HPPRPPDPYTFSLHDALPISAEREVGGRQRLLAEQVQEVALVLVAVERAQQPVAPAMVLHPRVVPGGDTLGAERQRRVEEVAELDRKSTRLNSSHVKISYAVF